LNSTTGAITATMNFATGDFLQNFVGKFLLKLSGPAGHFPPLTNSFAVTNHSFPQKITGNVVNRGTNVPNAAVVVMSWPQGVAQAGTMANNSGGYSIALPPGAYMLAAVKSNHIADFGYAAATVVNLGSGQTVTANLTLTNATASISGKVVDASNPSVVLPAVMVMAESESGLFAPIFTDINGNFTVRVRSGQWNVRPSGDSLIVHGYLGLDEGTNVNAGATGVTLAVPQATALVYGSVQDSLGNPMAGIDMSVDDRDYQTYDTEIYTDANGKYVVGLLAGDWSVGVSGDNRPTNYIFTGGQGVTLTNGQVVQQNFTALLATNHISGWVRQTNGAPIAGVGVWAQANVNGRDYQPYTQTDSGGNYTLPVGNGVWTVGLNCFGGDDRLQNFGNYQCPQNQTAPISNNNAVAQFTVRPPEPLQITTTTLPDGTVGEFYDRQLWASGGQQPYHWYLPGGAASLPPGMMNLSDNGELSGTPTAAGTYNFWVGVWDYNYSQRATQFVSLTILAPLQITTTSLPNGTQNTPYSQQLTATGGQQPYHWYLPGGTAALPPGTMNLSDAGLLSGTPAAAGTYNFWVGVWDANWSVVNTQFLTLTINPNTPLQITTTWLPTGTNGAFYSQTLQAIGGQPPYTWSLAPYSASLPATLTLATNGVLSGIPATNGTFYFYSRVTDGAMTTADSSLLQLNIVNPPLQITTASLPSGVVGVGYTNQLTVTGGYPPYSWCLATGSAPLPANLTLGVNGLVSGVPEANGTFNFLVQVYDSYWNSQTKPLAIVIYGKPVLSSPVWLTNRFQMWLTGATNQNYTIQMSTNLSSTNWTSLFITNNALTNSFIVTDPNATNKQRFYRVLGVCRT